jgi:hypothetical protein
VGSETRTPHHHATPQLGQVDDSGSSWIFDCTTSSSQSDDHDDGGPGPQLADADAATVLPTHLLPFPYADHQPGITAGGDGVSALRVATWLDGAFIERDLSRAGLGAEALVADHWTVTLRGSWFHEEVPGNPTDLWISELQVGYRFIIPPVASLGFAVGPAWLHDAVGDEGGVTVGVVLAVYPLRPLSVQTEARGGSIGSAGYGVFAVDLDAHFDRWAVGAGWEITRIGAVRLDGPRLVARVWW